MRNKNINLRTSNTFKIFIVLVIMLSSIVLSSISVNALGVAPSRKIVDYSVGEQTYTARIINNENKDMKVLIYFQGELAEYAKTDKSILNINSNEPEKSFTYTIKVPEGLSPGTKKLDVMILELSPDIETDKIIDKTTILSTVLVIHQLRINVPYPGMYAEGTMYISSNEKYATITVNVLNKGTMDIRNINGELVIKGPTNEEITRIKANIINEIKAGNVDKFIVNTPELNPGIYYAEFIVNYENKQFVLRKTFTVGSVSAEIKDLRIEDFRIGYIAKVNIDVLNRWNLPINDAYAILEVIDKNGNIISETKTASTTLKQLTTTTLTGYWDSKGITTGIYDMKISLYYNNLVSEKIFDAAIGVDSVKVNNMASGMVTAKRESEKSNTLLYVIVLLLVIVNIFLVYVYFKYIRKKNNLDR